MNKGKLIISGSQGIPFTRIFVNPDSSVPMDNKMNLENRFKAYDGMIFYLCSADEASGKIERHLIDDRGKDISRKAKNNNIGLFRNSVPLSKAEIQKLIKQNSSLFKKADANTYHNILFPNLPDTERRANKVIINTLKYFQDHSDEDDKRKSFFEELLKKALEKRENAFLSIDHFISGNDINFSLIFNLEWNDNFDFSKLYLLRDSGNVPGFIRKYNIFEDSILLGPAVYDGNLYFGDVIIEMKDETNQKRPKYKKLVTTFQNLQNDKEEINYIDCED